MTGKLHPKDFLNDPSQDASNFLVNNLILNNPSGRNIKFSTTRDTIMGATTGTQASKPRKQMSGTSRTSAANGANGMFS